MNGIRNAKFVQRKSRRCRVLLRVGDKFMVKSPSGARYRVQMMDHGATCTCDWGMYRPLNDSRAACSHVLAVFRGLAGLDGQSVSAWTNVADAARQHRPTVAIGDNVWLTYRKDA